MKKTPGIILGHILHVRNFIHIAKKYVPYAGINQIRFKGQHLTDALSTGNTGSPTNLFSYSVFTYLYYYIFFHSFQA